MLKDLSEFRSEGEPPAQRRADVIPRERLEARRLEKRRPQPTPVFPQGLGVEFHGMPERHTSLLDEYRDKVRTTLEDTSFLWQEYQLKPFNGRVPHVVLKPGEFLREVSTGDLNLDGFKGGQIILRVPVRDQVKRWKHEVLELPLTEFSASLRHQGVNPIPTFGRIPRLTDSIESSQTFYDVLYTLDEDLRDRPGERTVLIDQLLLSSLDNPMVLRYPYLLFHAVDQRM